MAYQANVYRVMIASPSDVSAERGIVREVIHEWNAVHSLTQKIVLQPIGWETNSSPSMGGTPQSILNEQILENCDLLVGVFWTRIGTKTEDYASGSVEEIERHIKAGKPAMLYFSSAPVLLDSVDNEQYSRLKEFKSSCQNRGVYHSYSDLQAFRDVFYRHLQLKINEDDFFSGIGSVSETEIVGSSVPALGLSKEAIVLLKEAVQDRNGYVTILKGLNHTLLQTNNKDFITDQSPRSIAIWEDALNQLVVNDLLVERGSKGNIFQITKQGYEVADGLIA